MKNLLIFLIILISYASTCQTDSVYTGNVTSKSPKYLANNEWKEKVTYGGNFQVWIGNPTFVLLSPTIGYIPFNNFNFGVGVIYNYSSFDYGFGRISQSVYGGHSFARYVIRDHYFLQVQYDKLKQRNFLSQDPKAKTWVDYLLVGGGLRQPVGERSALLASLMYNLTPSPLSIYPNRIIAQFGFVGGF
jgi:hypothetical protein